jgi:hypothetical protein
MKNLLTIAILMVTIIGCNNINNENSMASGNEKLVKKYFEHFNNHEWEKMANLYVETADFKDTSLG